ncbi:transposase [Alkalibacterium sp. m-11]
MVLCYMNGEESQSALARRFGCTHKMIGRWASAYRQYGIDGLKKRKTRTVYTDEFKKKLIMEVLGGRSQQEVLDKYHIHPQSHGLLSVWIKEYTSGIKTTSKGSYPVNKGRKTTFEERLTIVEFALENHKDYQHTAETFKVSYQQVYGGVRKYELDGKEGLEDRRGQKKKSVGELSEVERLEAALKAEQHSNRQLQMENDLLKKLNEIEQTLEDYR